MARVLVATQPWGLFWIKTGQRVVQIPLQGEVATINTTVYAGPTGSDTIGAFVTNDDGELPGWVEEGDYTLTVNGEVFPVSAVSGSVSGRITAAEGRLTTAEGRLTSLEGRLTTAEANISNLQGRLTTAEANISNLQGRMTTAETDINSLKTRATNLETRATNLEARATSLESRMTTAESNISNLQSRMTTAESNISNLQSRMTTAESNISNLQSRMTTAENNIANLQSRMTAVENRATALEARVNRGAFSAWIAGPLLIQSNTFEKVTYTTEQYDVSGWYNPSLTRYQPAVAGYFRLNAQVMVMSEPTDNFQMKLSVFKNGSEAERLQTLAIPQWARFPTIGGTCQVESNGSDYFEIFVHHNDAFQANFQLQPGRGNTYFHGEEI